MTDKEMLELAAKAAGVDGEYVENSPLNGAYKTGIYDRFLDHEWNPLTDDGDALRLAVELKLDISFGNGYYFDEGDMTFCGERCDGGESRWFKRFVKHNGDPYAATRRAIVRAAAEIGKEMK